MVDAADRVQLRLFVVELVNEYGFAKIDVHRATAVSRQTIDDWLHIVARWGKEGLLHSAHRRVGGAETAVRERAAKAALGCKAHRLRAERREVRERKARARPGLFQQPTVEQPVLDTEAGLSSPPTRALGGQVTIAPPAEAQRIAAASEEVLDDSAAAAARQAPTAIPATESAHPLGSPAGARGSQPQASTPSPEPLTEPSVDTAVRTTAELEVAGAARGDRAPFAEPRPWTRSRYAGGFIYRGVLEGVWKVSDTLRPHLGSGALAIWVFIMMLVHHIPSVEQLKTVFPEEFGILLGLSRLPSRPRLWDLLTSVYERAVARKILADFVRRQIRDGLVSLSLFYVDGHFLPYTGQEPVRYGYWTQRQGTFPGRTVYLTHEPQARIVTLDLHEGHGDLQQAIRNAVAEVRAVVPELVPRVVFDREGWSLPFFRKLETASPRIEFLTWEKHTPEGDLDAIAAEEFGPEWKAAGNRYRVLEQTRDYQDAHKEVSMTLRRIILWNLETGHRVALVSNSLAANATAEQLGRQMLDRWGVSENGMKRLSEHCNFNYSPGYQIDHPSPDQLIANPRIKDLDREMAILKQSLGKVERKLGRDALAPEPRGKRRRNPGAKLCAAYQEIQRRIGELRAERDACPRRVPFIEVRGVELERIDEESKTLFDTAQLLVHNAQRYLVNELKPHYEDPRDPLVVLRMVAESHGWVRVGDDIVEVRLEALPRRQYEIAQRGLLARLNAMHLEVAPGKRLQFELGPPPITDITDPGSQAMSSFRAPQRAPV